MYNDSSRISANEINRYIYCNYQWYYKRFYGDKVLTQMKKEHNKALGIKKDARTHAFIRGNKFHRNYHRWYQVKKVLYMLLLIALIVIVSWVTWQKLMK